ncbi:ABC transporter permease [Corynebacterium sp. CNCTC7651]|uniref:ABC transporter permease n=1 Tax=Corynebacterium sp. CNCTC7651 TaxID=2815361 RepID=UPI001F36A176|nr:ABC transporter permease [Corynebacterium sp. CNCTC7651]UIZ91670.1 ABC transporter permease [Corynebacterium sp. CNCTC7651]
MEDSKNATGTSGAISEVSLREAHSGTDGARIVVDDSKLRVVRHTLSFGEYIKELRRRRDFIFADAKAKAFRTTRNYRWWQFWLIANPVLEALMYGAIFGLLLKTNRGIDNFVGYVIIGMAVFSATSRMLMGGVGLLEANRSMLQTFSFPRAAVVLSNALRYIYDTLPSIVVAIVVALAFQAPAVPSWTVVLTVPLFFLAVTFGTGLMFIAARMTALLPETRVLLDLFMRGWMFSSGIFYSIERFAQDPLIYQIFSANPAYRFIRAFRDVVMYGNVPSLQEWLILTGWALGTFVVGFVYFWGPEKRYAKSFS